jgi:hypothetical protein
MKTRPLLVMSQMHQQKVMLARKQDMTEMKLRQVRHFSHSLKH